MVPVFEQIEQLHVSALSSFVVTRYRTAPQWQPPVYVVVSAMSIPPPGSQQRDQSSRPHRWRHPRWERAGPLLGTVADGAVACSDPRVPEYEIEFYEDEHGDAPVLRCVAPQAPRPRHRHEP